MKDIPDNFLDIFDKKAFGVLCTLMPDKTPQASIIWFHYSDDGCIYFNSITKRQKYRNIKNNPQVSLLIVDPDNPYRYIEIRGKITVITPRKANEFVDVLSRKYLGSDIYPYHRPGVTRVIYKLVPEKVFCYSE
ncbi:MAG: PPOX class F420-dependent oxidoreductase [Candidatus Hodarchaeales archaeon]